MTKTLLATIALLTTINFSFSQKLIKGSVTDHQDKKPIPYVNIGIQNSTVGTISNEDGSFMVAVPDQHSKDTLLFSSLGYKTERIVVSQINPDHPLNISLKEQVTQLEAVTVSAKKEKRKTFWLGNKFSRGGNIYADSASAGSAMALLIENKYPAFHKDLTFPVFIEKALLNISINTFDEFKVRIRILDVDSITDLPGKDLFNENVIEKSKIRNGWVTFDLSSFNFQIDRPAFFIVFEWILEDKDRLGLIDQYKQYRKANPEKVTVDTMMVRGEKVPFYNWYNFKAGTSFGVSPIQFSLNNYKCYYRNNSFGEWKRASTILTARLLVSSQPK